MTNPFKKLFFFVLYFSLFSGVSLWAYYTFKDSPFKRELASLDLTHSSLHCPESPSKNLYQECLRPKIAKLSRMASPIEILSIPGLLDSYHNQDLIQGEQYLQAAHKSYIINQVIFYESLNSFSIRRDSIDFFQIVMLPYFRWQLERELKEVKENAQLFLKDINQENFSAIESRYFNKFNQLNMKAL